MKEEPRDEIGDIFRKIYAAERELACRARYRSYVAAYFQSAGISEDVESAFKDADFRITELQRLGEQPWMEMFKDCPMTMEVAPNPDYKPWTPTE